MGAPSEIPANSASVLFGVALAIVLASMASGWLFRVLLLGTLRSRHPAEFAALGRPSTRQLESLMPRHGDMQVQFWRYLWSGKVFRIKDRRVSALAAAALISDVALVGGVVLLFWSARQ